MTDDWRLLQEYAKHGSQTAFTAIVERYVNFVYSTCLREVDDLALAEDVTQPACVAALGRRTPDR